MKGFRLTFNFVAIVALTLAASSLAQAQASRTFVSGVGDDVNPCSRTAPCRTFAGAISKTVDGGEINVLDPGSFGSLTITKNITVDGGGNFAGITAAGVNGVTVNDSATASPNSISVALRNLSIDGLVSGNIGVRLISGKSVLIENCQIFRFRGTAGTTSGRAISDERTGAGAKLIVVNTTLHDNSANAVVVNFNQAGATTTAVFDHVRIVNNTLSGIFAGSGAKVTIRDSFITANGNAGVQASDANTEVYIADTVISHNSNHGIVSGAGAAIVRISNVTIGENGSGVTLNGGTVESFGNNNIRGNASGNAGVSGVSQL